MRAVLQFVLKGFCLFVLSLGLVPDASAAESRTWSDATGKFKIEAKFVSVDSGKVTLLQADGTEIEIPLAKLSTADQKVANDLQKAASDNPFKAKAEDPFKPKKLGTGASKSGMPAASDDPVETRRPDVDWTNVEVLSTEPNSETWSLTVPELEAAFKVRPKSAPLPPKSGFFEGMKGLAVHPEARKAVVGYVLSEPRPQGQTRIVVCDLESTKTGVSAIAPGQMTPLAVHPDGRQILMRSEESGSGRLDRLEVWTLKGTKVNRVLEWVPYANVLGSERDVTWAEFARENLLVTSSQGGRIALWSYPEIRILGYFETVNGAVPCLSPDRKWLACSTGERLSIFDLDKREVLVQLSTPSKLQFPRLAFSPSGKRLGCVAFDKALVWDVATGKLETEIPASGAFFHGPVEFPHDDYLLAGGKTLLALADQLKLWQYDGADQLRSAGGWTFIGTSDGTKPGALIAAQLPHTTAVDLLKKAKSEPNLFVLREGTTVKIDASGIADASAREQVILDLMKRLDAIGCKSGPGGTIDLVAAMEGPVTREMRYLSSGEYKVQEWKTSLKFVYQGKVAWQTAGTNVPGMLWLNRGENVESVLRSKEKPDYSLFTNVNLPKLLQKPSASSGPLSGNTLGQSRITPTGIK